jgi:hypothetical protein
MHSCYLHHQLIGDCLTPISCNCAFFFLYFLQYQCMTDPSRGVWSLILLRTGAGPWQVMLKQADGSYACIAESTTRFTLGEVYIFLKLQAPFLFVVVRNNEYVFILIIWISLDQRRTVEGAGTARGRRQLTRISPQRLQGSSDYLSSFFHLYIVPS